QVAHHRRARTEREHRFLLKRANGPGRVFFELDADEKAEPADLADAITPDRAKSLDELRAALPSVPCEVEPLDLADRRDCGCAGQRISAEGGRVRALGEVADLARERDRAHGHPAGDRFGEAQDVRHQSVLVYREERARPAEAGLDLVDNQEGPALGADTCGFPRELTARRTHAALSLHELEDERGGLIGDRRVERLGLVERNVRETGNERTEHVPVLGSPRRRERAHGLPVKAAHRRDDSGPLRRGAREFESALDGFGPAVAEKDPIERGGQDAGEHAVELGPAIVVEELGAGREGPRLLGDRVGDRGVAVAKVRHALTPDAIDVRTPLAVEHCGAFATHEDDRALGVEAGGVRVLGRDEIGGRPKGRAHDRITVRTLGSPLADRMTTSSTPPSIASRAARIFTFMRPRAIDSASAMVVSATSVPGSSTSRSNPGTLVRMMSASASIATAIAAATRSPSTLSACCSVDSASGATTGTRPAPMNCVRSGRFTASTFPV